MSEIEFLLWTVFNFFSSDCTVLKIRQGMRQHLFKLPFGQGSGTKTLA